MTAILLENVRSIFNVGGIFRIADAVGAEKIFLVGYTPTPIDRMGRNTAKLAKTALGAEKVVRWQHYETVRDALSDAKEYTPIIVEQTPQAIPYTDLPLHTQSPLFVFGNERDGIDSGTCSLVEHHIYLPMRGNKESLNITTCAAVVLYHFSVG